MAPLCWKPTVCAGSGPAPPHAAHGGQGREAGPGKSGKKLEIRKGRFAMLHAASLMKSTGVAAVLALPLMFGQVANVQAEKRALRAPSVTTQVQPRPSQIADQAQDYSLQNPGVGIFLNIGPQATITADQIGNKLVSAFARNDIQSAYFVNHASKGNFDVTYFVKGVGYGPYTVDTVKAGYQTVVADFKQQMNADLRMR